MRITYLGHAGFCAEDERTVVVMDPWLSTSGAFDSAWFQFPPNHHLASFVRARLGDASLKRYIYVSHEHQDHFDADFLGTLEDRDFTLVVPRFSRATLLEKLQGYRCAGIAALEDCEQVALPKGYIRLYLDDSVLNRDSAALIRMGDRTFFNMNDCKLFDRLNQVHDDAGHVDFFACQFTGATWHPTCYEYDPKQYAALSKKKSFAKFETVARAIEALQPGMYLPSAGPACFLDPDLFYLNFESVNIFPHPHQIAWYLSRRLRRVTTNVARIGPGAVVEWSGGGPHVAESGEIVDESDYGPVLAGYQAGFYKTTIGRADAAPIDVDAVLLRLCDAFAAKLEHLSLAEPVSVPLYFRLFERSRRAVKVDFAEKTVSITGEACPESFYEVRAPAWQVSRVLDGHLTWEEFSLTFRVKIRRNPDVYRPAVHAFLLLDAQGLKAWCGMIRALQENEQRITVDCAGQSYSVLRYCPHQGGDLLQGWLEGTCLVCPRHRWHFDLAREGQCIGNDTTIRARIQDGARVEAV